MIYDTNIFIICSDIWAHIYIEREHKIFSQYNYDT